jgi:excisionase family DNA binding protein
MAAMNDTRTAPAGTSPLFVRLSADEAARLDRAAHELGAPKREIIGALVAHYVDPATPAGLEALRALGVQGRRRTITLQADEAELPVGRHSFHPAEPPEVLTLEQLAALLQVDVPDAEALLEAGTIPARQVAGRWRVARRAVLDWLSGTERSG